MKPLPAEKYYQLAHNLHDILQTEIPRRINYSLEEPVEQQGYCTDFKKAYCTTIYVRTRDDRKTTSRSLAT